MRLLKIILSLALINPIFFLNLQVHGSGHAQQQIQSNVVDELLEQSKVQFPHSEIYSKIYQIKPEPLEENQLDHSQLILYSKDQLNYISGLSNHLMKLFSKKDFFICPGRSCVHFTNILKVHGYSIASPSFSKGHNVLGATRLSEYDNIEQKSVKYIELQKKLKNLPEGYLKTKDNLSNFLKDFEDLPIYIDFASSEIKASKDFSVSKVQNEGYRQYLKDKYGIFPDSLKAIKGNIVLFDSVCSGGGMGGFIKVLLDWCNEEGVDVANKIKVVNFNYRTRKVPEFESNNPLAAYWNQMLYMLVPEKIWREFSYNHIDSAEEEHFFFPPWTWDQRQLWEGLPTYKS